MEMRGQGGQKKREKGKCLGGRGSWGVFCGGRRAWAGMEHTRESIRL